MKKQKPLKSIGVVPARFHRNNMNKRWHVYILRCRDGSLYTGITTDVNARIEKHNAGKGAAYTRSRKPVTLAWSRPSKTESAARKREAKIKSWTKTEKERFLEKRNNRIP